MKSPAGAIQRGFFFLRNSGRRYSSVDNHGEHEW